MVLQREAIKLMVSKWVEWTSPDMTGYGDFGGTDYGVEDSGVSTTFPGYYGWKAFNSAASGAGSYNYNFYVQKAPNYVTFYSPKPIKISDIYIGKWQTPADGYGVEGVIEISMDNINWTTIATKDYLADWRTARTLSINSDVPCKYVRFTCSRSAHSWGSSLGNIVIYGFRKE